MNFTQVKYTLIILVVSLLSGCSGYEKLLKSNDYALKYEKAKEYYAQEDYTKAGTLFEQILPIFRGTNKADSIMFYQAYSNFYQRDYYTAGYYFKDLTKSYPGSDFYEESLYMIGYCFYQTSPRPELDQEDTRMAIESFQLYTIKYPEGEWASNSKELIAELNDKLVEKSYLSAKLYYDLSKYKASVVALNNALAKYPETIYREDIMFLLVKSRYFLADNSIEDKKEERFQATVDDYFSFITEFPESKFRKEVDKMYEVASARVNNQEEQ